MGKRGIQHLGKFSGIGTAWAMTSPYNAIGSQFVHCIIYRPRMRIASGEFEQYIFVRPYSPRTKFPISPGVTTDQRDIWKTLCKYSYIHWSIFARRPGTTRRPG